MHVQYARDNIAGFDNSVSCRHTYISQMQTLGVDLATIQNIVGHADIDMTMHYLHIQEEARWEAIGRISDAFPVSLGSEQMISSNDGETG